MISFPVIVVVVAVTVLFVFFKACCWQYLQSFCIYRAEVAGSRTSADCQQQLFSSKRDASGR